MTQKNTEKSCPKKDKMTIIEEKYGKDFGIRSEDECESYLQKLQDKGWWALANLLSENERYKGKK